MPYITPEYYHDVFLGDDVGDLPILERLIVRASDLIDQVTGQKLRQKPLEEWPALTQDLVRKATAAQVEYYAISGGVAVVDSNTGGGDSVKIGSFAYTSGKRAGGAAGRVSPAALAYLKDTGLLYQGLDVRLNVY